MLRREFLSAGALLPLVGIQNLSASVQKQEAVDLSKVEFKTGYGDRWELSDSDLRCCKYGYKMKALPEADSFAVFFKDEYIASIKMFDNDVFDEYCRQGHFVQLFINGDPGDQLVLSYKKHQTINSILDAIHAHRVGAGLELEDVATDNRDIWEKAGASANIYKKWNDRGMLKGLEGETAYRIANCLEAQETFSSAFRVFDSHQETDFYRVSISLVRRIIPYVEHKFDNRNPNSLSNFDGMTSVLLIPYVSPKPFSANDSEYSLDKELIWLEDISKKAVEYINASVIKYPTWRSSRGTRIDFSKNVVFQGFSTKILGGKKYLAMTVSEKK